MTSMNFSIDIDRVQSSVQAAIRPAVERALSSYDMEAAIARFLESSPSATEESLIYSYFGARRSAPLMDDLVESGIREIAKEFVAKELANQRENLEDAFAKMMEKSRNKLVKQFTKAATSAISQDWSFDLSVKVEHETQDDDDD